ncbi:hypothetical protein CDD80_5506 [Ophiocordyceps camponoti-rufipedis]|uniref:Dolichyl-diphosphooligosaccharide--protein glycosyltransferase subunit OST2 n=1 Tax=Ophiocordyceps camponoti-rufipedis TaxID=2004952 RepID=A0A2C5YVN6_9HYPO|nr:hypothetical protein CDD80_5506 [Ophiocordyceps camponoti-rufipedis]
MAPKKPARGDNNAPSPARNVSSGTATPIPKQTQPAKGEGASWSAVLRNLQQHYIQETPQRTKLTDVFLAFLLCNGAVQFLYCVLAGNFPFNAFLAGFGATVGQFILTISLRIQTAESNKGNFTEVAFADYIVCSLVLHFFCVNFIN